MIAQAFKYEAPVTLAEAIGLLQKYGDEAKILSGGHSLIPMMKLRFASPEYVIDINNIPGLSHILEENGVVKIGALTRETDIEHSGLLRKHFLIFADASKLIADPQVRNRGTIGGNLAHGDAANDHPAVMLALNATVVAMGSGGGRTIPIDESGDKAVIDRRGEISGWVGGGCVQAIILKEADEAIRTGKARLVKVGRGEERGQQPPHASQEGVVEYKMTCLSEGAVDIFIEPVLPAPHLVVVGKSAIARALVRIGKSAGYRVSVVAPVVRPDTFDHPDELITQLDLEQLRTNTSSSFIVVCTQGEQDEPALEQSGIARQLLAAVRCPAGININAKTPEEVAVSILAEIIQVQHELPVEADRPKHYINPVCGMPVDVNNPKHVIEYKGELIYFCCDGCKVKFEEAPESYAGGKVR